MTLLWFLVWIICNNVGSPEPIVFNQLYGSVNNWAGTLLFAVSLDLSFKVFWRN